MDPPSEDDAPEGTACELFGSAINYLAKARFFASKRLLCVNIGPFLDIHLKRSRFTTSPPPLMGREDAPPDRTPSIRYPQRFRLKQSVGVNRTNAKARKRSHANNPSRRIQRQSKPCGAASPLAFAAGTQRANPETRAKKSTCV